MNLTNMRLRPSSRITLLTTLSTLTLWLGRGCASVNENRLTIGGDTVHALAPTGGEQPTDATGPSLIAGARDHWEATTIVVPIDGTEHQPTYTRSQPNYSKSPRATGVHPTPDSALDLASPACPQAWEAVAAPFHCAADIALFIPRAFGAPPWSVTLSPSEPFQRYRENQGPGAPELAPESAPITPPAQ